MVPKISIGKGYSKRSKFDLSNTCSGTLSFGEVVPTYAHQFESNAKIHYKQGDFIRLSAMVAPTFTKSISLKTRNVFVPYNTLFEGFDDFISQNNSATWFKVGTYDKVPNCNNNWLALVLLRFSVFNVYLAHQDAYALPSRLEFVTEEHLNPNYISGLFNILVSRAGINSNDSFISNFFRKCELNSVGSGQYPNPVTPLNSDFNLYIDEALAVSGETKDVVFCFRLNDAGKRIYKILLGLGYRLDFTAANDIYNVNLLPLFAFYKAYFDSYYPQRYLNYKNTWCYYLLHYLYDQHVTDISNTHEFKYPTYNPSGYTFPQILTNFFEEELSQCFYTYAPDYYSSQLPTITNSISDGLGSAASSGTSPNVEITDNNFVHIRSSETSDSKINAMHIKLLLKLQHYVNKNSIIGRNVTDYLKAHGLGDYTLLNDSMQLGDFSTSINVSDINVTANTETEEGGYSPVGSYTGKGTGVRSSSDSVDFEVPSTGLFVSFCSVVPDLGYCQGVDGYINTLSHNEFFHPEFDSLGFEATPKRNLTTNSEFQFLKGGGESVIGVSSNSVFGFAPRYYSLKFKQNKIFGDMFIKSMRDSLLPYTLDRFIPSSVVGETDASEEFPHIYSISAPLNSDIFCGLHWRFLGKFPWLSNYTRIFNNYIQKNNVGSFKRFDDNPPISNINVDNFIIHVDNRCTVYSYMLPVSESFDTEDNRNFNVSHT
ncbi:major capsid protein [Capybara microvirus Cap3_SP_319]|nr:major capsid protein [Capybara microvirus Cap3_SP_319]